jgi:hypothetical protein
MASSPTHEFRTRRRDRRPRTGALATAAIALLPALAMAQTSQADATPGAWRFGVSLYGHFPTLKGTSSVPADSNGTPIGISGENLVDSLQSTIMGSFDAHNGRWGVFTDLLYLNLGGNKQQSRDFTIGRVEIPVGTTADLDWTFKGTIWTLAGQYRVFADPTVTVDALAGVRWLDIRTTTSWNITGSIGPILPAGRTGTSEDEVVIVDGIVGVKGRLGLGSSGPWSVPFYADVGTGKSKLTWQAAAGISYGFKWGEVIALWRYLSYETKSGESLQDLSFSGPMVGATFRW